MPRLWQPATVPFVLAQFPVFATQLFVAPTQTGFPIFQSPSGYFLGIDTMPHPAPFAQPHQK